MRQTLIIGALCLPGIAFAGNLTSTRALVEEMTGQELEPMHEAESAPQATPFQFPETGTGVAVESSPSSVPTSKTYASVMDWANEAVEIPMIRGADFETAMRAILPAGWVLDLSGVTTDLSGFQVDLTSDSPRGMVMHDLLRELNLTGYPYVRFNTFVVTSN